jgi:hypothetical protein
MNTLPDKPLADLASEIGEAHRQCVAAASSALEYARRAGELLIEAKARVAHGEWLPWLKANFDFSEKTAQNYMRLAREWPKLVEANPQRVADLSCREALRLLAAPEERDYLKEANDFAARFDKAHEAAMAELARLRAVLASPGVTLEQVAEVRDSADRLRREFHAFNVEALTGLGEVLHVLEEKGTGLGEVLHVLKEKGIAIDAEGE